MSINFEYFYPKIDPNFVIFVAQICTRNLQDGSNPPDSYRQLFSTAVEKIDK